jgi:hypothetical protein
MMRGTMLKWPCLSLVLILALGTAGEVNAGLIWGINGNSTSRLFSFDSSTPGVTTNLLVTGLNPSAYLLAIEFRPADAQLYALTGDFNGLYRINTTTGAATLVSTDPNLGSAQSVELGMSWNPVTDELRFVSETDNNRRIGGTFGPVVTDTNLAYAPGDPNFGANPRVPNLAYTNKILGSSASSTTLYGIDVNLDALVRIGSSGGSPISPNLGQLFTVGSLGVDFSSISGFDIVGDTAYATSFNNFYTIDLTTGTATFRGTIVGTPSGFDTRDIAAAPVPEPSSLLLCVLGAAGAVLVARKGRERLDPYIASPVK